LLAAGINASRRFFFSQDQQGYYLTLEGHTPTKFRLADPPDVITFVGAVEDWYVENRSPEDHIFHLHQTHFVVMEINGVKIPSEKMEFLDGVYLPPWNGTGAYPSAKFRMGFNLVTAGLFVYHCHVLAHEDRGMMAKILVLQIPAPVTLPTLVPIGPSGSNSPCQRVPEGNFVQEPPQILSSGGLLDIRLLYRSGIGPDGNPQHCYIMQDGTQAPTLRVWPGDRMRIAFTNQLVVPDGEAASAYISNLHCHGMFISPSPGQDFAVTVIAPGETYVYDIQIPYDHPSGLYWYHPHSHGTVNSAMLAGASGLLVVEGIDKERPDLANFSVRTIAIRDQELPPNTNFSQPGVPKYDASVNWVPVLYPSYNPAYLVMEPGAIEFWRVINAGADANYDLQILYDGVPQPIDVIAIDGVAMGAVPASEPRPTSYYLCGGRRVEILVHGPGAGVKDARLVTLVTDNGPAGGGVQPARPLIRIVPVAGWGSPSWRMPLAPVPTPAPVGRPPPRTARLLAAGINASRRFFFSQDQNGHYITLDGHTPTRFKLADPPDVVTFVGAVEDWYVENRSPEVHVFHLHQTHFVVMELDGVPLPREQMPFIDSVFLRHWNGTGPYPSAKFRMTFNNVTTGIFVYHCHILGHEDRGMMAKILVVAGPTQPTLPTLVPPTVSGNCTPCLRVPVGNFVQEPAQLVSSGGLLDVRILFKSGMGPDGNTQYCYMTQDGLQSPTLRVKPGDLVRIAVSNQMVVPNGTDPTVVDFLTNLHLHGTFISPAVGSDFALTVVAPGDNYVYSIKIPESHPPGLYWYHPHLHGSVNEAMLGGASGLFVIDGLEKERPEIANLPVRTITIRDQNLPSNSDSTTSGGGIEPGFDLSVNWVPILYPTYTMAFLAMEPGSTEFWRIINAGADSICNIQLLYDGVPQPFEIIALDGVAMGAMPSGQARPTSLMLPSGRRAEVIIRGPTTSVADARLVSNGVYMGSVGVANPTRPLVRIVPLAGSGYPVWKMPAAPVPTPSPLPRPPPRTAKLIASGVNATRRLFFSQDRYGFYVSMDGATPARFHLTDPPSVVTFVGAVEDWYIENRSPEAHIFHIHQTHYVVTEINGVPVLPADMEFIDSVYLPYWNGSSAYPSVKFRISFNYVTTGTFVYHCHLIAHEDSGMMAIIKVLPSSVTTAPSTTPATTGGNTVVDDSDKESPCPRKVVGGAVREPLQHVSAAGLLDVRLFFKGGMGSDGNMRYCYLTQDGVVSPTLRIRPGDLLRITLTNLLDVPSGLSSDDVEKEYSTNLHLHGMFVSPIPGQDYAILVVQAGQTFIYEFQVPSWHPSGLFWYHPHFHGLVEVSMLGGASGLIIVEGLEQSRPEAAGLPARTIMFRDQNPPVLSDSDSTDSTLVQPAWDLSVNWVPVLYPAYKLSILSMEPGATEVWMIVNGAADTVLNIQLLYDGVAQPFEVVAEDGVPVGSLSASTARPTNLALPSARRVEVIVKGPSIAVSIAQIVTLAVDSGSVGAPMPARPLVSIAALVGAGPTWYMPTVTTTPAPLSRPAPVAATLYATKASIQRRLFFSQDRNGFYITLDGLTAARFSLSSPPDIVTTEGAVEDWYLENRSPEIHIFHIHQTHFIVVEVNQQSVSLDQLEYIDSVTLPPWSGSGSYPSVKMRMSFNYLTDGLFVYHCHIIAHEERGMMGKIQVLPSKSSANNGNVTSTVKSTPQPANYTYSVGGSSTSAEPANPWMIATIVVLIVLGSAVGLLSIWIYRIPPPGKADNGGWAPVPTSPMGGPSGYDHKPPPPLPSVLNPGLPYSSKAPEWHPTTAASEDIVMENMASSSFVQAQVISPKNSQDRDGIERSNAGQVARAPSGSSSSTSVHRPLLPQVSRGRHSPRASSATLHSYDDRNSDSKDGQPGRTDSSPMKSSSRMDSDKKSKSRSRERDSGRHSNSHGDDLELIEHSPPDKHNGGDRHGRAKSDKSRKSDAGDRDDRDRGSSRHRDHHRRSGEDSRGHHDSRDDDRDDERSSHHHHRDEDDRGKSRDRGSKTPSRRRESQRPLNEDDDRASDDWRESSGKASEGDARRSHSREEARHKDRGSRR